MPIFRSYVGAPICALSCQSQANSNYSFAVTMTFMTRLTLSHNRIHELPAGFANLVNLEILNVRPSFTHTMHQP